MSSLVLTKTKLQSGVWQGILEGAESTPDIKVSHLEREVSGTTVTAGQDQATWVVQVPIPSEAIADGVQTLLICDRSDNSVLDKVTIIAGDALGDDLRAEVDLLRAELDMLKRAFRRHCTETMS